MFLRSFPLVLAKAVDNRRIAIPAIASRAYMTTAIPLSKVAMSPKTVSLRSSGDSDYAKTSLNMKLVAVTLRQRRRDIQDGEKPFISCK